MIEPFSLSTFLLAQGLPKVIRPIVQAASDSVNLSGTIDKIFGGFIGNNTNDAIRYVMKNVWQRMHQGGPPVNQDLQKAARKAYLMVKSVLNNPPQIIAE